MASHFSLGDHSSKKHFPKILLYLYLSTQKSLFELKLQKQFIYIRVHQFSEL